MVATSPSIISLEEFNESINMVLYSDPGIGKTVWAGTDNVLFLAMKLEKGTISAARMGSQGKLWKINSWHELEEAHSWLEENPDHGFDWVVVDSVTAMQKMCMRGVLDDVVDENPSRDLDLPALQDWQKYYNVFDRYIAEFNDLPVNVLYTATTMQNEDADGEEIVLPNLVGRGQGYSISASLCASVGIVARMSKEVEGRGARAVSKRKILFDAQPPYFAKNRYDRALPLEWTISDGEQQFIKTLKDLRLAIESSGRNKKVPAKPAARKRVPARPKGKLANA